jgi:hypothetical protein
MCGLGRAIDRFRDLVGGYSRNFHKLFGKRFINTTVYNKKQAVRYGDRYERK